jgi:hypothetical protein
MEAESEEMNKESDQNTEAPDKSTESIDNGDLDGSSEPAFQEGESSAEQGVQEGDNSTDLGAHGGDDSAEQEVDKSTEQDVTEEPANEEDKEENAPSDHEAAGDTNENGDVEASDDIGQDRNESESAANADGETEYVADSLDHLKTAEEQLLSSYQNACTVLGIEPIKALVDAISTAAELGDILTTIELKGSTRR